MIFFGGLYSAQIMELIDIIDENLNGAGNEVRTRDLNLGKVILTTVAINSTNSMT